MCNDFIQNILTHPLKTTIEYYATCVAACAKAVAYLARNCLASDTALQVGFADRTLGTHFKGEVNGLNLRLKSSER